MNAVTYDPAFLTGAAGAGLDKEYVFIQYGPFEENGAATTADAEGCPGR